MSIRRLRWRFYRKTGGPRGVGNRCKDYAPGCIGCESYRFLNCFGRFPSFDEVVAISDAIHGNPPYGTPATESTLEELVARIGAETPSRSTAAVTLSAQ